MQSQPKAVLAALLPEPVMVGAHKFRPLTIGDVCFLEKLQSPLFGGGELNETDAILAAFLLTKPPGEVEADCLAGKDILTEAMLWHEQVCPLSSPDLAQILKGAVAAAFDSCAQTRWNTPGLTVQEIVPSKHGNGLGWLLTLIDALCCSYGWTLAEVRTTPLVTAFALLTARRVANGAEFSEPNYFERDEFDDGLADKIKASVDKALADAEPKETPSAEQQ